MFSPGNVYRYAGIIPHFLPPVKLRFDNILLLWYNVGQKGEVYVYMVT